MAKESADELLSSLDKLFKEGTYSDLTITCGDDEYKVHKAIICPRSSFFATACGGPFQEGRTGVVALPDDNPQAVKLMIRYLYYSDYPTYVIVQGEVVEEADAASVLEEKSKRARNSEFKLPRHARPKVSAMPNLTIHARVYALGEKYDIKGLKALALEKFKKEAIEYWDSHDFIQAVEEVYTSTIDQDRGMRDAVVQAIRVHPTVLDKALMQDVVRRLDLCFDLMMKFRDGLYHYETPQTWNGVDVL
jgi:hypothetical protein